MKKFLNTLNGHAQDTPPLWLMRQAGRYLPEYRALREEAGSFLSLVYDPVRACDVTMQPIRRYGFDAAILFSDILVIPQALGSDLSFTPGEGPVLSPVQTSSDLDRLGAAPIMQTLEPITQTVRNVRKALASEGFADTALIGFAGAPWTTACYMVQGHAQDHDFTAVKARAYQDPVFFGALIEKITQATTEYLAAQIRAGAQVIQIFESWASAASDVLFDRYVIAPVHAIVHTLRREFPDVPVIAFPRGAGNRAARFAAEVGAHGLGCDQMMDMRVLAREIGDKTVLQGNLDPAVLLAGGAPMYEQARRIMESMQGRAHVFNLGHGVLPQTPPQHVADLVRFVRTGEMTRGVNG